MTDNKWEKKVIVFKLKSPLHIGFKPFTGSVVSPTRYYIPGRNLWGAITKNLTELQNDFPKAIDYNNTGIQVIKQYRFSYFYIFDGKFIYYPHFTKTGLKYGDTKKEIQKSTFEHKFIRSKISTSINNFGTAKDKSLHEIEFIRKQFLDEKKKTHNTKLIGFIWKNKNYQELNEESITLKETLDHLILGGESRYGFGHVQLDSINKIDIDFPLDFSIENDEIHIKITKNLSFLPAHMSYDSKIKFKGDIELISGRGYINPYDLRKEKLNVNDKKPGSILYNPHLYIVPGSVLLEDLECKLQWDGTLVELNE
ncbi:RAMP superfamily CRISPR-associated protein [Candidatus Harpocratesius sp.]